MTLPQRDHESIWHPCSQMKDYETFEPLVIRKAKGGYLILDDGRRIFDAISSWWCKNLGHGHPRLRKALIRQSQQFEHVILANTTHENIVALSEELIALTGLNRKVFYASDGSSAVEIALKMVVHARQIQGQSKTLIAGLANGYHGETLFALSVSDVGLYRSHYKDYLVNCEFIQDLPYLTSSNNLLWHNIEGLWIRIESQLSNLKEKLSAIIVEPIVQGAGGMKIYSPDFLRRLSAWCHKHDVYLIADEIMTGFGRTGEMFAYEYAGIDPDIVCLGKGLTSGYLPMSAVVVKNNLYNLFYDEDITRGFLHSHTQSGNALAAAVALETLHIIREEGILQRVEHMETLLAEYMLDVAQATKQLHHIRHLGAIAAADLKVDQSARRLGYEVYQEAVKQGALLRPLGNTLYWLPPLNSHDKDLKRLRDITIRSIRSVLA